MEVMDTETSSTTLTETEAAEKVERYFLRLALMESDEKLQKFTDSSLVDILELAGSHPSLLEKSRELLAHYNRRVRKNLSISLPVSQLLNLIKTSTPVTAALSLVYLKYSRERLTPKEHVDCLPAYIEAIGRKLNISAKMEREELLSLTVPAFSALSTLEKSNWPVINLSDKLLKECILRFFHCILSFNANHLDEVSTLIADIKKGTIVSMPGLSSDEYLFIAEKVVGDQLNLTPIKCAILKLLGNGLVDDSSAYPLFILATSTNLNAVEDLGDGALKRIDIPECLSSSEVVDKLMKMYLGSNVPQAVAVSPKDKIAEGSPLLKQKITNQLSKSKVAARMYMINIKVALDAVSSSFVKLRISGLQFLLSIISEMPPSARTSLAPILMKRVKGILGDEQTTNPQVCSLCYRCISELGKQSSDLACQDLAFVETSFREVAQAPEDVVYSIVDMLVAWIPLFCAREDEATRNILQKLIGTYVVHLNPKCRLVSLKYVEALLRADEIDLKWMLIRACGDSRDEMRNEATRLLEISLLSAVPSLELAIEGLWEKAGEGIRLKPKSEDEDKTNLLSQSIVEMLCRYIWAVCEHWTGEKTQLRIVEGDDHWMNGTPKAVSLLSQLKPSILGHFQTISLAAAKEAQDVHVVRIATAAVLSGTNKVDSLSVSQVLSNRALSSTRLDYSTSSARLSALLMPDDICEQSTSDTTDAFCQNTNPIPGSALVCSSLIVGIGNRTKALPLAQKLMERLTVLVNEGYNRPSSLLDFSLAALSQLLKGFHSKNVSLSITDPSPILDICLKISSSRKEGLSTRARECAVSTMGYLPGNTVEDTYKKTVDSLYAVAGGPPQPELQFFVGRSLFDAALSSYSPSRRDEFLKREEEITMDDIPESERNTCEERLTLIFNTVADEKLEAASHHVRRAALIWLFVLCQKATHAKCSLLSNLLDRAQAAFADGLTENDDFTQDVASKGVGLVYSQATEEQKKALVGELVSALSEGRRVARQITGDTKMFEKGQLGKTPDGESLTTYKELCSLATDLNQPDLLYKFMQLAKHNAAWNAKAGAAFGFGVVFEQAKAELDPYIGKLVPKLFRYRYDPDSKVQASMKSIWTVLTSSRKNVVDEYADDIAKELIPNLTHKEWRVRESSCLALSDLLRGHDTAWMHSQIPEWIDIILRLRDDIKESVRIAAERTADSLRKLAVRLASSNAKEGEKAAEFISILLPILIEKGVHSSVKMNKAFSLKMLMELSREAGSQMRPWLHEIIPCLLDAISDTEHTVLNYLAARSDEQELEALDDARARMARTSPMMTAIHDLLPQIDSDVLVRLQPSLCDQLRGSIGVSTRTAAAQMITHLALRAPQQMMSVKGVCDKLFNALRPGVRDRNPTVRKQFGSALSYLAKFVNTKQLDNLMAMVTEDLLGEKEEQKAAVRVLLKSFSANASEVLSGYAPKLIPYVFLEKCKPVIPGDTSSKKHSEEWNELWNELVPSTDAAVRLYGSEIIGCALEILENNTVWAVRAQAAQMIENCARIMGEGMEGKRAVTLLSSLLPLLSGRLWDGKGKIVNAVEGVIEAAGPRWRDESTEKEREETLAVLKREASKKNKEYKVNGLNALAVMGARTECIPAADFVRDTVAEVLEKLNRIDNDGDASSSEEGLSNSEKEARSTKFLGANTSSLAVSLQTYREVEDVKPSIDLIVTVITSTVLYWKVKLDTILGVGKFLECNRLSSPFDGSSLSLALCQYIEAMQSQRSTVAEQAVQVLSRLIEMSSTGRVSLTVSTLLPALLSLQSTPSVSELVKKVQNMEKP